MKNKILPWEHWKQQVDWDAVKAAILEVEEGDLELNSVDYEMAVGMVWDALDRWVPLDKVGLNILGLERAGVYGPEKTKYVIDILAETIEDGIAPYKNYPPGTRIICDWKSAVGNLDQNWRNKYIRSWQARIYCAAEDAPLAEYRGISHEQEKDSPLQGPHQTKPVIVEMPASNKEQVDEYLRGTVASIRALEPELVYPRKMPKACGAWGRDCEYLDDCILYEMPKQKVEPGLSLSFSRIEKFYECPEKYRRGRLGGNDSNSISRIGSAMHRGLAEAYSQLWEIPIG